MYNAFELKKCVEDGILGPTNIPPIFLSPMIILPYDPTW